MIECGHKSVFFDLTHIVESEMCHFYDKPVNDKICSQCAERCDGMLKPPLGDLHLPLRSQEQLDKVQKICEECPLFDHVNQTCQQAPWPWPTSIMAKNINNHCPLEKW